MPTRREQPKKSNKEMFCFYQETIVNFHFEIWGSPLLEDPN